MRKKIYKILNIIFAIFLINFFMLKNSANCNVYAEQKAKIIKTCKINGINKIKIKTNVKIIKNINKPKSVKKPNGNTVKEVYYSKNMPQAKIDLPVGKNVVILNPGHGFEDNGATVKDPTQPQNLIREKVLNAKITYELAILLLNLNFDVYLIYDLKEYGLELPKNNPRLHILFNTKPKVSPNVKIFQISAHYIKEIMKTVKNANEDYKTASICLHHNHCGKGNPKAFGFMAFYRNDKSVSKNFANNSKNLAECFLKCCKNIYDVKKGANRSGIASNKKWLVCSFGSDFDSQAAVLLELGFMSNVEELKKILNDGYRKKMAQALAKALCEYYKINNDCLKKYNVIKTTNKNKVVNTTNENEKNIKKVVNTTTEVVKNSNKVINTKTVKNTNKVVKIAK